MTCSKRSLCKQVACEWDMIVALSETRLEVCFFSLNVRLQQVILVGKKKTSRKNFSSLRKKNVCKTTKAMGGWL